MSEPGSGGKRDRRQTAAAVQEGGSSFSLVKRSKSLFRPFLIEVAGHVDDAIVKELADRLRKLRNRYFLILRFILTLTTSTTDEASMFGDGGASSEAATPEPMFYAPKWAVAANRKTAVVPRLHSAWRQEAARVRHDGRLAEGEEEEERREEGEEHATTSATTLRPSQEDRARTVLRIFDEYVAYRLLPRAITHNFRIFTSNVAADAETEGSEARPVAATAQEKLMMFPEESDVMKRFVLRHYVHESTRTASFLIADVLAGTAAIIDPTQYPAVYAADLAHLGISLTHIIVTHCFLDVALRISELTTAYPDAKVVSGLPLRPAGHTQEISLSSCIHLRAVAVPSFSPECLLVELRLEKPATTTINNKESGERGDDVLVALFTGTVWSTDAVPRADVYDSFLTLLEHTTTAFVAAAGATSSLSISEDSTEDGSSGFAPTVMVCSEAMRVAQANLKALIYDTYLFPTSEAVTAVSVTDALDNVVMFPSHGGYSNVTNQLDLYWCAHLGDLVRMRHSRAVIDTLASGAEAYARYCKRLPPLPQPQLFVSTRKQNLLMLLCHIAAEGKEQGKTRSSLLSTSTFSMPLQGAVTALACPVIFVDVRDAPAYHAAHLQGSVNIPMSFPADTFGAKKAEVWLQCILLPQQPIVVVCASVAHKTSIMERLRMVSPGSFVEIYTMPELMTLGMTEQQQGGARTEETAIAACCPPCSSGNTKAKVSQGKREGEDDGVRIFSTLTRAASSCGGHSNSLSSASLLPEKLSWMCHFASLGRVDTYEKLTAVEPNATTVILDVRTPFEFKSGSHQHSVHLPLSELCTMTAVDTAAGIVAKRSEGNGARCQDGPSSGLGLKLLNKMHEYALVAGLDIASSIAENKIEKVVVYCAGGYRSLIAASLLLRAFEVSSTSSHRHIGVSDVRGGAFQIMTQRPDLWLVKDRSIICIS